MKRYIFSIIGVLFLCAQQCDGSSMNLSMEDKEQIAQLFESIDNNLQPKQQQLVLLATSLQEYNKLKEVPSHEEHLKKHKAYNKFVGLRAEMNDEAIVIQNLLAVSDNYQLDKYMSGNLIEILAWSLDFNYRAKMRKHTPALSHDNLTDYPKPCEAQYAVNITRVQIG